MNSETEGFLVRRAMTREGIRHRGSCWNSPALAALRARLAPGAGVLVRFDPADPAHAFALDETRGAWVETSLQPARNH